MAKRLDLENVNIYYGDFHAVQNVNMQIPSKAVTAFIGPSGCGKSTLLNIAAGLTAPDGGRVLLDGTDITALPPEKRRISLMFQDYALLPHLTVLQNTAFGLKMRGTAKRQAEEAAKAMLEQVGLSGEGHRRPDTLSGGEQQRLCIARAVVHQPSLLIADEPSANLDRAYALDIMELFKTFHEAGTTVIVAAHDETLMADYGHRILRLQEGRFAS